MDDLTAWHWPYERRDVWVRGGAIVAEQLLRPVVTRRLGGEAILELYLALSADGDDVGSKRSGCAHSVGKRDAAMRRRYERANSTVLPKDATGWPLSADPATRMRKCLAERPNAGDIVV